MRYDLVAHGEPFVFDIEIPTDAKTVGIMVSGGVDSAGLLCALAIELQNRPDVTLKAFTVSKVAAQIYAKGVIEAIAKKYGVQIQHCPDTANPDAAHGSIRPAIRALVADPTVDYLFTGVNDNPPKDVVVLNDFYPNRPTGPNPYSKVIMPFMPKWKSHIVALAKHLDVFDILGLTHTCTERTVDRCGMCFACDERRWAFEANAVENPLEPSLTEEQLELAKTIATQTPGTPNAA